MATSGADLAAQDSILEALSFPEQQNNSLPSDPKQRINCVLCPETTPVSEKDTMLKHLVLKHKLVIADVRLISDFPRYMLYWKERLAENLITDFCSVIKTNATGPVDQQEEYYLLCDALPEDRILREQLQQRRLEEVLEQQQRERDDGSFQRVCLFCSEEFSGNRSYLLNHMAREHSFSVGLPDNIVYCSELLDTLEKKLDNLQCLYCEKTFRDKATLKDHMRKKQHRRINANNQDYDRFYIINYLELGKTWEDVLSEDDRDILGDNDDDWSDWHSNPVCAVCLFCEQHSETMEKIYAHMEEAHGFDLHHLKTQMSLSFYQQVKLVNYIRREIHQCQCYSCKEKFGSKADVLAHLAEVGHIMALQESSMWDQPQYYFPTYENDALLCTLTDSEEEAETIETMGIPVIAEDMSDLEALKQSSVLKHLLKS